MLDGLTEDQRRTMASHGFPESRVAEVRAPLETNYAWLLEDDARVGEAWVSLATRPSSGRAP